MTDDLDKPPVIARDRVRGYVLLGNLGFMGVGRMWFHDGPEYAERRGYDTAPEMDSAGQFGTDENREELRKFMRSVYAATATDRSKV